MKDKKYERYKLRRICRSLKDEREMLQRRLRKKEEDLIGQKDVNRQEKINCSNRKDVYE